MKWIVQAFVSRQGQRSRWEDIPGSHLPYPETGPWEADDAGEAFSRAVLENEYHRLAGVSYRVLPYTGGATFNVGVNVDAVEHDDEGMLPPVPKGIDA